MRIKALFTKVPENEKGSNILLTVLAAALTTKKGQNLLFFKFAVICNNSNKEVLFGPLTGPGAYPPLLSQGF